MSSFSYDVFLIPKHPTQSDIAKYAGLRLLSLQTNPECFGSNHTRESAFTEMEWRSRLTSHDKAVIVASCRSQAGDDRSSGGGNSALDSEWVGTLSILTPEALRPLPFTPPIGDIGGNARVYGLFAMCSSKERIGEAVD